MSDRLVKRGSIWHCWFYKNGALVRESTRCRDRRAAAAYLKSRERVATGAADVAPYALADCLEDLVRTGLFDVQPQTIRMYVEKAGHWVRLHENTNVHSMSMATVQEYIRTRLDEGAARTTISKELVTLRRALSHARDSGRYYQDPKAIIPRFKVHYRPRQRYLTREELRLLLAVLEPHRQLWVIVAVFTGGRDLEVDALTWQHIDWSRGVVTLPGTKTQGSYRQVPLSALLARVLEGSREETGHVVGEWMNVRRDLARACKRAKIERVTPNDLRRTYATWLKQDGVDSAVVARLLGHKSTRMVDLVYGVLDDDTLRRAVERLPGGCVTGVQGASATGVTGVTGVTGGQGILVGESLSSVLGPGIEPGTRGFSIRVHSAETARLTNRFGDLRKDRVTGVRVLRGE